MKKKQVNKLMAGMLCALMFGITGCGTTGVVNGTDTGEITNNENADGQENGTETTATAGADGEVTTSELEVTADMAGFKDDDIYTDWKDLDYTSITLDEDKITMDGSGAVCDGTVLTINEPGTYVISGTLKDGAIIVNSTETSDVRIVLDGVDIHSEDTAPVQILSADKVIISLEEGTNNLISDAGAYDGEELTAAVYSKADLVFNGSGTLQITANVNNAVQSKDDLRIMEGTYIIEAADDGLVGKDQVSVKDGNFTITSGGDGIKSTNSEETDCGFVYIENGEFNITADSDGIQAETGMLLADGTYVITANGGYENAAAHPGMAGASMGEMRDRRSEWNQTEDTGDTDSTEEATEGYKGLKAGGVLKIQGGTYTINASNDAVHSNYKVQIENGTLNLQSGDDGIHADEVLVVDDGTIDIDTCYEGIESADITINDGVINLTATDDGFNAAGGAIDESVQSKGGGMMETSSGVLTINGGTIHVDAAGDGLDSNGSITQTGGDVIVMGPTDNANGALDYGTAYVVSGGTLLAVGSSGMMQAVDSSSTENSIVLCYTQQQEANSTISITDASGNEVLNYTPEKSYSSFVWVSGDITTGSTYSIYGNDNLLTEVTISQVVTSISDTGEEVSVGNSMPGGRQMEGGGGEMKGGRGAMAENGNI